MKKICAWCQKDMGETPEGDPDSITHGICEDCLEKEREKLAKLKKEAKEKEKPKDPELKIR